MIDWLIVATVAGPVLGVVLGAALTRALEGRPRLVAYYGHVSSFRIQAKEPFWVFTHNVVVRNSGKKPANDIRLGHAHFPASYTVLPDRAHEVVTLPNGSTEILISNLLPAEEFTVSYLYYPPITWDKTNTYVKSDEGFARIITVLPQQQYPRWVTFIVGLLMLVGTVSLLYIGVQAVVFISR